MDWLWIVAAVIAFGWAIALERHLAAAVGHLRRIEGGLAAMVEQQERRRRERAGLDDD